MVAVPSGIGICVTPFSGRSGRSLRSEPPSLKAASFGYARFDSGSMIRPIPRGNVSQQRILCQSVAQGYTLMSKKISKTRRRIAIGILVLAPLTAVGYTWNQRTQPTLLTGPMVQLPAADALAVSWTARAVFTTGWVELTGPAGSHRECRIEPDNGKYEARFDGLTPGAYTYTIFNEGLFWRKVAMSGPHQVRQAATRGEGFRFIAFGDSGNGSNTQANLATVLTRQEPDVVIHVGDLVYPAGAAKDYRLNFFEPNAALIRSVPFMPSLGNHDVASDQGRPMLEAFTLPENGPKGIEPERNYYFDYGDARFVALDSNRETEGGAITHDQMKTVVAPWVRSVLNDCDARWKFVYFHHPFYTGSSHAAEGAAYVKEAYVKVFEESGVDVVFCGHNHLFERTAPIKADQIVSDGQGIVYVTTGAGGVSRYPEQDPPPPYIRAFNDTVFSFTRVDVTADRLEIRQINEFGEAIDTYAISHTRQL